MKIRITFDPEDVVERGEGFIELGCRSNQSPMMPAFVMTVPDNSKPAKQGRYLLTNQQGALKLGQDWSRLRR